MLLVLPHFGDVLFQLDGVQARHLKESLVSLLIPRNVSRAGLIAIIPSILRTQGSKSSSV